MSSSRADSDQSGLNKSEQFISKAWTPFPRDVFVWGPINVQYKSYTSLAVDDFDRWLCTEPECTVPEYDPRWDWIHLVGYAVVGNGKARSFVFNPKKEELYPAVKLGKNVAYFANPPVATRCLHTWSDANGMPKRCMASRMNYLPVGLDEQQLRQRCDPSDPVAKTDLKIRMRSNRHSERYAAYNRIDKVPNWEKNIDPPLWKGAWACPKCLVSIDQIDKAEAWKTYAMALKNQRKNSLYGHYMKAKFRISKETELDCFCFINTFNDTKDANATGLVCSNQKFGLGLDLENEDQKCRYRYGAEPSWDNTGEFLRYTGP